MQDDNTNQVATEPVSTPVIQENAQQLTTASVDMVAADSTTEASGAPAAQVTLNDLQTIKQQALQQLSPLIQHIDQTPDAKFRLTMAMIQANDDQSLITAAYELAQQITDDKMRAQALLDVVNEVNYFTQQRP
jgi:hypothetical protein